ncbi:hypothetical protein CROQUDRAFT_219017 [Cronartium quercuum f. sp. fusiforme G11]|uniref:Uncharacterized protein n=1 Tax=Cronartium quercuum f. sp. fusiforme G11 TaxID=708437 RepID=A0A9P6T9P2_9BASI|nr:hypothetical protein CROQUDRAFT_219017 [Cronartium quercuum f. sp. fusiforme G11]
MILSIQAFISFVLFFGINSAFSASIKSVTRKHVARSSTNLAAGPWWYETYKPMSGVFEASLLEPRYILANMIYNWEKMRGTETTQLITWKNNMVYWYNFLHVTRVKETENIPLSYAFVGMLSDLKQKISDYSSIPVEYHWNRMNYGPTKANVCLDFVISDDSQKNPEIELMLWLEYEGGQKPIGYGQKSYPVTLYNRSWILYQGPNKSYHSRMVITLVPDQAFENVFIGDAKVWLMKLVELGKFSSDARITAANMGMEAFWGHSQFKARSRMDLLWEGNEHTPGYIPKSFVKPITGERVPGY